MYDTVKSMNDGHFGNAEVVSYSEVRMCKYIDVWNSKSVH